jgi:hypothetical protein
MTRARDVADVQENLGGAVPPFAAGKNKIINGDFGIWQRGTSFTPVATLATYTADRFLANRNGTGTVTVSQQTFNPGTAPVSGYEGQYFFRFNQSVAGTGATFSNFSTRVEDVRTFAGQTVTLSFWAKTDSARSIATGIGQNFGSGGSAGAYSATTSILLTTSWQRFTITRSIDSVSGKTIGAGSFVDVYWEMPLNATFIIDIWGVQLEAGSTATAFQTATGTIQGELASCQRYYAKTYSAATAPATVTTNGVLTYKTANTDSYHTFPSWRMPVEMRGTPTITLYSPNTGTSGKIYTGATDVNGTAAGFIGSSGASPFVNNVSVSASNLLQVHLVAEAEL